MKHSDISDFNGCSESSVISGSERSENYHTQAKALLCPGVNAAKEVKSIQRKQLSRGEISTRGDCCDFSCEKGKAMKCAATAKLGTR